MLAFFLTFGAKSFQPRTFDFDLVAFYCGGAVTAAAGNPYRVEPLRACEHSIGPVFRSGSPLVVPDPLPPYDQTLFALVSYIPYRWVQILWFAAEFGAFAATVVLLRKMCALQTSVIVSALLISDLYTSALLGQLVPICLFGIVLTGWALERQFTLAATAGLLFALTEPHLGLPATLAIFLFGGGVRASAVIASMLLAMVAIIGMPLRTIGEYFSTIIPAHALSEVNNEEQLSLTYALHSLGVSDAFAFAAAKVDYALMLVMGVFFAQRLARKYGTAIVPFGATVFVLVGGPFVHVTQMGAALPAALLLAGRTHSKPASAATTLLAVPWLNYATILTVLPIFSMAIYVLLRRLLDFGTQRALFVTFAATSAVMAAAFYVAMTVDRRIPIYGKIDAGSVAESVWKTVVDSDRHGHVTLSFLAKIPTEAALLLILFTMVSKALTCQTREYCADSRLLRLDAKAR